MRANLRRPLRWLLLAWSAYVLFLLSCFYWRKLGVARNHLESAWLIESVLAVAVAGLAAGRSAAARGRPFPTLAVVLAGQLGAWLLYGRSLSLGLFSDDFVLVKLAEQGSLARGELFRPLPAFVWLVVVRLVGPDHIPAVLHALNVILHGLNASLVVMLAWRLGISRGGSIIAGVVFIAFPASVEAVVWPSGIQDVLMTTCCLSFLLLLLAFRGWPSAVVSLLLLSAGLLTKETAISACGIATLLVLINIDARGATAATRVAIGAAWLLSLGLVAWRFAVLGPHADVLISTTRRGLEHFLTASPAALGSPWGDRDLASRPIVGFIPAATMLLAVVCSAILERSLRMPALMLCCVLAAVFPVGRVFFIPGDLENSRYLYLPSVFFAIAVASLTWDLAANRPSGWRRACGMAVSAFLIVWVGGAYAHQRAWQRAAAARDAVLSAVRSAAVDGRCARVYVATVDNVEGAYVFRNGLAEAIDQKGLSVTLAPSPADVPAACRVS